MSIVVKWGLVPVFSSLTIIMSESETHIDIPHKNERSGRVRVSENDGVLGKQGIFGSHNIGLQKAALHALSNTLCFECKYVVRHITQTFFMLFS